MDYYQALLDMGLDPAQIDQIMQLGVLQSEQSQTIPERMERAKGFQNAEGPRGRQVGNVYQRAHGLEFLSGAAKSIMGDFMARKQQNRREELAKERQNALAAILKARAGGGSANSAASAATVVPWNQAPTSAPGNSMQMGTSGQNLPWFR